MINPQLTYGTTLAQGAVNPQALLQQTAQPGLAQIPTGTVTTESQPTYDYKVPSKETSGAMERVSDASGAEREAKERQKEADVKLEGMESGGLANLATIAEEKKKDLIDLRKRQSEWSAAVEARREAEIEDFKKTSTSKSLFEDMTPLRRMLSAIAVGAGQWAATMSGTGRNGAYEIFKESEDNWRKSKEAELKARLDKMAAAGKSDKERLEMFDKENDLIEKTYAARNDYATKALKSLKATVPQAAARADAEIAKSEKEDNINHRNFVTNFDKNVREPGMVTQTSSGDKSGAGAAANRKTESEQKLAMLGSSMKAELNAITKGPALTEKDLQGLQDNTLGSTAADKKAESGPFGAFIVGVGRWADMIPRNRYDGLSQEKKIVVNAWDNAVEKYARILTGAGMPAEEARRMGLQNMPVAGDDAKSQKFKFDRLMREADFMMSLSNDAKAAIVKRLQEGETFDSLMPAQEAPQPAQPTGKVGSPNRVRGIPPSKQDAAATAADDYVGIVSAIRAKSAKLTPQEEADFKEAYEAQKKAANAGSVDEDAARYMRQLRQRKGI